MKITISRQKLKKGMLVRRGSWLEFTEGKLSVRISLNNFGQESLYVARS